MRKIILALLCTVCVVLIGCSKINVYQPTIQQGNLLFDEKIDQLRPGMSKPQVLSIMGNPVLENLISENHWAYVYTLQIKGGAITKKRVDVYFQSDRLVRINRY